MVEKIYLKPQQLLDDSFALAAKILDSGFAPKMILALWRGGTPVGIAVQEYLGHFGPYQSDHIAIRTSSYHDIGQRRNKVDIYGMSYLWNKNDPDHPCPVGPDDPVLIVDDVYDTGLTVQAVIHQLQTKGGDQTPRDIRVAVPWFKPAANKTDRIPDYYLHTTDKWLNFPHELDGLKIAEIRDHIPDVYAILKQAL